MGAAVDLNQPQNPAPPEPAPAPTPAPAPEPGSAPAGGEGSSAQPASAPPAPSAAPPAPASPAQGDPEAHVPYPRFRQVQREYTQYRRDVEPKVERYEQQIRQYEEEKKTWASRSSDYDALETLLRENPDIAESLLERARGGTPPPRTGAPARSPQPSNLPPHVVARLDRIDKMAAAWEESRAQAAQQREQQETQQLSQTVDTAVRKFLVSKNLSEELHPIVRAYVIQASTEGPYEGATVDELPYLLGDWYRRSQGATQGQMRSVVDGKQSDARLVPPTPGTSATPIVPPAKVGALDETTVKTAEEMLAQRLGWNNNGGV